MDPPGFEAFRREMQAKKTSQEGGANEVRLEDIMICSNWTIIIFQDVGPLMRSLKRNPLEPIQAQQQKLRTKKDVSWVIFSGFNGIGGGACGMPTRRRLWNSVLLQYGKMSVDSALKNLRTEEQKSKRSPTKTS